MPAKNQHEISSVDKQGTKGVNSSFFFASPHNNTLLFFIHTTFNFKRSQQFQCKRKLMRHSLCRLVLQEKINSPSLETCGERNYNKSYVIQK